MRLPAAYFGPTFGVTPIIGRPRRASSLKGQALFFFFRSHPRQAFILQLLVRLGRRFNNGNVHAGGNQQQKQCHKVAPTDGTAGCQSRVAAKAECTQIRAPLTANGKADYGGDRSRNRQYIKNNGRLGLGILAADQYHKECNHNK